MEKKKALAYKKHLIEAQQAFIDIMEQKNAMPPAELKRLKRRFSVDEIENAYQEFEDELRDNCDKYNNFDFIYSFLRTTFRDLIRWENDNPDLIDSIIKGDYEVEYLLKLHQCINDNFLFISRIADQTNDIHEEYVKKYYEHVKVLVDNEVDETYSDTPNPLFVFNNLKAEIDNQELLPDKKLELVQQRLYDFLQWQKAFDKKEEWSFGGECEYEITSRLYPKFEAMCRLEIERWKAVLNTLQKKETALNAGTPTPKIRIASRKKLDVIKVFSAMYDLKWFTDGNHMPLTNKQQLMDAIAEMLGDDFKSYSTNLSQAKDKTPEVFLKPFDDLKKAGKKYLEIE